MSTSPRSLRLVQRFPVAALFALAAGACLAAGGAGDWRNATTGGALRPGVYGRIVIKSGRRAPPVIYPRPVVANTAPVPQEVRPVYLYVPPGQVRKWKESCVRWSACGTPVLFVRFDHSPSQWGRWRELREDIALHEHGLQRPVLLDTARGALCCNDPASP